MTALDATQGDGFNLYDHAIVWQPFPPIPHLELTICDIDEERGVVDLIVRFAPNETIAMHNHIAQTNMFIIQGELIIYTLEGDVREVRKAGHYFRGRRDDLHTEGGGAEGAVVFYSFRGHGGNEYLEVVDDKGNPTATVTMDDFKAVFAAQNAQQEQGAKH
jgi:hypothetical protein